MAPGSLAGAARLHPVGLLDLAFGVIALCRGYSGGTRVSAAMRATQGGQRPGREGAGGSMEGHRRRRRRRCPRRKLDVGPRKSESIDGNFKERRLVKLRGKRIVVLVADGFEDLEYWVTVMRLREEGAEVISAGPNLEPVHGKNYLEARADVTADEVDPSELDGLVIPGGWAPDKLRRYPAVTNLVKDVHERGRP